MPVRPILAVLERELLKLVRQRGRLLSSMVRPLLWLLVIGAGLEAITERPAGMSYRAFLVPGVLGMTLLFGGMLASLATVYDKEAGVMRMLIVAPLAHQWLVLAKALGSMCAALLQALLLLVLLGVLGYLSSQLSIPLLALGLVGTALVCASLGMLVAAYSRTLDNYATMMNLVIFPVFFLSGALYPVADLPQPLQIVAAINPFTHGVDLLKHAALAGPRGATGTDFSVAVNVAALLVFSVAALAVAAARFSREAANEPLIRRLARQE